MEGGIFIEQKPKHEVPASVHQKYSKIIHINPNTIPSGTDRKAFNSYRRRYWKERAKQIKNS